MEQGRRGACFVLWDALPWLQGFTTKDSMSAPNYGAPTVRPAQAGCKENTLPDGAPALGTHVHSKNTGQKRGSRRGWGPGLQLSLLAPGSEMEPSLLKKLEGFLEVALSWALKPASKAFQ